MSLEKSKPLLDKATQEGYAVGAFNVFNELVSAAIVHCCEELRSPVILQTSVSTVKQIGAKNLMGFLRPLCENATVPVAVHLDHCTEEALAMQCIDVGWTSIMIDASHLPLQENIEVSRRIVAYAHKNNVSVEGELGAIGGVEDTIVVADENARLASVSDSVVYCRSTGVDLFAPAIGTAHGPYSGEPKLDFDRLAEIKSSVPQPIVVHGGTGLSDVAFRKLIDFGAAKINISTALKQAYLGAISGFMTQNSNETNPLKLDKFICQKVAEMTAEHLNLFGSANRV